MIYDATQDITLNNADRHILTQCPDQTTTSIEVASSPHLQGSLYQSLVIRPAENSRLKEQVVDDLVVILEADFELGDALARAVRFLCPAFKGA